MPALSAVWPLPPETAGEEEAVAGRDVTVVPAVPSEAGAVALGGIPDGVPESVPDGISDGAPEGVAGIPQRTALWGELACTVTGAVCRGAGTGSGFAAIVTGRGFIAFTGRAGTGTAGLCTGFGDRTSANRVAACG